MLEISLYSNDSLFLEDFSRELSARLGGYAGESCRFKKLSLTQLSLYENLDAPPDLCVVDLREDPRQGLDFVRRLRRGAGTEVMVVAPGPDWAMEAYDADVLSYFLDPPDLERAARLILRRFAQRLPVQEAHFSFRTPSGAQVLAAERIVYVEYSEHRLLIHTDLGQRITTTTMRSSFGDSAAQLLADRRFIRTHASFLVNIMHIAQFGRYVLTMDSGTTVPVSHARWPEVKRHFNSFFKQP